MEKNKSITVCVSVTVICLTIAYLGSYLGNLYFRGVHLANYGAKNKELEIGLHDMRTYCMKAMMDKSRKNGHPCTLEDAERACRKVEKDNGDKVD